MKRFILLGLSLLFLSTGWTQSQRTIFKRPVTQQQQRHVRILKSLLNTQTNGAAVNQRPTATFQRVIGMATFEGGQLDSTTYSYSGLRGSSYNYNLFDGTGYPEEIDASFDSENPFNVMFEGTALADTLSQYSSGGLTKQYVAYRRSETDNRLDSLFENNPGSSNYLKFIREYNAQGKLSGIYSLHSNTANPSTFDTFQYEALGYDSQFIHVLTDSIWTVSGTSRELENVIKYDYDVNGNLTQIRTYDGVGVPPLSLENKTVITYNNLGLSTISFYDDGINLDERDSFVFAPGLTYYTQAYSDFWDNGSYDGGQKIIQFPNANGLPDSVLVYFREEQTDPYDFEGKAIYQYNTFNNPTGFVALVDDDTMVQLFYYEEYDNAPTAINTVPGLSQELNIFPNPFHQTIQLNWKGNQPIYGKVQLVNVLGQVLLKKQMQLNPGLNELGTPSLPDGIYMLEIQDNTGRRMTTKVIHQ